MIKHHQGYGVNLFPEITHIDQLREKVGQVKEIRFSPQPNGTTVVCYMISDEDTFGGEHAEWKRECRGITFDKRGKIAARPLHKFFNVGERPETQATLLDWGTVSRVMSKRDGSMIHPVIVGPKAFMKSKKSFESDVAQAANALMEKNRNVWHFCWDTLINGYTPIFEYTAPNARIVINYGSEPELQLLHVRHTIRGDYMPKEVVKSWAKDYNISVVEDFEREVGQDFLVEMQNETDVEGYVFQFSSGDMVKAKTPWYLELHHAVTFQTYRSIAEMVLGETLDDYKSYLSQVGGSMDVVHQIEHQVVSEINEIQKEVDEVFEVVKNRVRKEVAIEYNKHRYFKLIMDKYSGKEINYKDFYRKAFLKERFSVEQIGE